MLKLRAWHKSLERFMTDAEMNGYEAPFIDGIIEFPTNVVLMHFTDLPDKNGKEICQSDRLKYVVKGFPVRTAVVEALPGRFTFYWEDEKDGEPHTNPLYVYSANCWEIIGNIHEKT